jgi:hypothetical protein
VAPPKAQISGQTRFSAEQDFLPIEKQEVFPPEALLVLAQEKGVASCPESNELAMNQLPTSWSVASHIHLGGPHETDFVVLPNLAGDPQSGSRCFLGAIIGQFWVLRKTPKGYRLFLQCIHAQSNGAA